VSVPVVLALVLGTSLSAGSSIPIVIRERAGSAAAVEASQTSSMAGWPSPDTSIRRMDGNAAPFSVPIRVTSITKAVRTLWKTE